jgi:UBX domain-containing protein 1
LSWKVTPQQDAIAREDSVDGSAIPGDPGVTAPAPVAAAATTSAPDKPAQPTPDIDPSLPQTTIQLRLADGTRLVTQFNLSSTMEDVYTFIARARPTAGREFVLQTIFPTRVLENSAKTVEEEGLKGER